MKLSEQSDVTDNKDEFESMFIHLNCQIPDFKTMICEFHDLVGESNYSLNGIDLMIEFR
jgi:hypothetical protein